MCWGDLGRVREEKIYMNDLISLYTCMKVSKNKFKNLKNKNHLLIS